MFSSCRRVTSRSNIRHLVTKPSEYGQPTFFSHPHLVKHNELTPGISISEYEQRRRKLMEMLPDKALVVLLSTPVKYMSESAVGLDIFYKYRQSSNFWYLTGFEEPNSAVILEKNSSSRGFRMFLFCSGTNIAKAKWDGASTSHNAAKKLFHADDALSLSHFSSHIKSLLPSFPNIFTDISHQPRRQSKWLLKYIPTSLISDTEDIQETLSTLNSKPVAPFVGKLRSVKSTAEQAVMRAAADISARAHTKTMRFAEPDRAESALAAHFEYLCALGGAQRPAYVPVVASGPNSLILHYTHNNQIIQKDELVLIDAGCEYNGYASDITRTFPASGTFSPAQSDLYNAVLSTQKQMIALCSQSAGYSQQDLHRKSCQVLKTELNQIGFNLGKEGDLERVLYPHYLGHPIGIDIHESTHLDRTVPLKAGMVITIEPGVYVPPTANFPKHFHNLGIRIEDEVLVGEEYPTILSISAPKEIVDVEGSCQGVLGLKPDPTE